MEAAEAAVESLLPVVDLAQLVRRLEAAEYEIERIKRRLGYDD